MRPAWHRSSVTVARPGFTLLEILIVVTIVGLITGVALPRARALLDSIAVRAAVADAARTLELARHTAMTRGARATVVIDSAPARVTLLSDGDTIRYRDETAMSGVRFHATRPTVVYNQLGMGVGVSNLSLYISRGTVAETLTVSRLGRVRR
jgi:prepilin-type N-terminal cleavage/methylation domain-containing protein